MRIGEISFVLKLKDSFTGVLNKAKSKSKQVSKSVTNNWKKTSLAMKAAWVAVGMIITKVLKDIIFLTGEAERAQARLEQQFKNVGIASEENLNAINELADRLQRLTSISNDEIVSAAALAASYNLNFEQIRDLLPALVDLAAFTAKASGQMVDLESTVKLMGYVLEGQVGRLKLMGITFTDVQKEMIATGSRADKLAAFLKAVETNAGGVAEAMGETAIGSIKRFGNAMDDLKKQLGEYIVPLLGETAQGWSEIIESMKIGDEAGRIFEDTIKLFREGKITKEDFNKVEKEFNRIQSAGLRDMKKRRDGLVKLNGIYSDLTKTEKALLKVEEDIQKVLDNRLKSTNDQVNSLIEQVEQEKLLALSEEELQNRLEEVNEEYANRISKIIEVGARSFSTSQQEKINIDEEKNKLVELNTKREKLNEIIEKRNSLNKETNEILTEQSNKYTQLNQNILDLIKQSSESGESLSVDMLGVTGYVEGIQEAFKKLQEGENESSKEVKKDLESQKTKIEENITVQQKLNKEVGENFRLALEANNEPLNIFQGKLDNVNQRLIDIRNNIIELNNTPISDDIMDI